jgi:hypothetical protein
VVVRRLDAETVRAVTADLLRTGESLVVGLCFSRTLNPWAAGACGVAAGEASGAVGGWVGDRLIEGFEGLVDLAAGR